MKGIIEDVQLLSPIIVLQKILAVKDSNVEVCITDRFGHSYNGVVGQLSVDENILLLYNKCKKEDDSSVIFLKLDSIVSLSVFNPQKHSPILTGLKREISSVIDADNNLFCFKDYIEQLETAILNNCDIKVGINVEPLDELSQLEMTNVKFILDNILSTIIEISQDDFGQELISKVDTIQFNNIEGTKLMINIKESVMFIELDLKSKLPWLMEKQIKQYVENSL